MKKANELTTGEYKPTVNVSLADMQIMAAAFSSGGLFGVKTEAEALSLMLICHAEGLHPALAVRRYHIIDHKPAFRADAMQGEFEQRGAVLWHERNDDECSASFWHDKKKVDGDSIARAHQRYKLLKEGKPAAELAVIGELTIIRTMVDAVDKKLAMTWDKDGRPPGWVLKKNWKQSPRQMLHARCLTEGVRAISPGIVAGIYTEDEIMDFGADLEILPPTDKAEDAKARVTAATTNRLGDGGPVTEAVIINEAPAQSEPITEENYRDLESHVGQAGKLLGQKVGEMSEAVIRWLHTRYGPGEGKRWGAAQTPNDQRLKAAVDIAVSKLAASQPEPATPAEPVATPAKTDAPAPDADDWKRIEVPFTCRIKGQKLGDLTDDLLKAIKGQLIDPHKWGGATTDEENAFKSAYFLATVARGVFMDQEELIAALLARADELIITEAQLDTYLKKDGMLDGDETIRTAPEKILRYVYQNWDKVKAVVQDDLGLKADPGAKPKRRRAGTATEPRLGDS